MAKYERLPPEPNSELRLVLVGQERSGKSSTGNTILGQKHFDCCSDARLSRCDVPGYTVSVVDTPGLSNTYLSKKKVKAELVKAINESSPGPHVFLLIIPIGRFDKNQQKGLKTLKKMLSPDVSEHTMVLFTFGDRLDTNINQFINDDKNLTKLLEKCSGEFHVFNNKEMGNRSDQVRELLEKIDLVSENRQKFYCRPKNVISYIFRVIRYKFRKFKKWKSRDQHAPEDIELLNRRRR